MRVHEGVDEERGHAVDQQTGDDMLQDVSPDRRAVAEHDAMLTPLGGSKVQDGSGRWPIRRGAPTRLRSAAARRVSELHRRPEAGVPAGPALRFGFVARDILPLTL